MAELDTGDSGGHGKKRGGLRSKKMSTRIDMTPLVDLGFLLVTFFMMTTTFNKPNAMEVVMPVKEDTPDSSVVAASEALTVIIAQKNRVFYYKGLNEAPDVQQTNYGANGLRKVLVDFDQQVRAEQQAKGKKEINGPVVLIKAIDDSEFGHMVDVLDEMKISGIKRYAIVDITPGERDMLPPI
ncbi:MAG TPA: biopolymer transporter ExbD [Chitinophagales bacterium]|nr:biopolymer transporter ExbD [Chitinophagales bacterium]